MSDNSQNLTHNSVLLFESHISELMSYTRKSEEEVISLIFNCMTNRNHEWAKFSQSEYSVIDFHRLNESSMYCLTKWNCEDKYQEIIRYISSLAKIRGGLILDFGGGIGELAINLVNKYSTTDFMEVPGNTLEYAKWRFNKRALDINIYTSLNQISKKYDTIICLDVLEVLEKPLSHLTKLYEMLKDDGLLILSRGEAGSKAHPMNLEKNKEFLKNIDKYCDDLGLKNTRYEEKHHLIIKQK